MADDHDALLTRADEFTQPGNEVELGRMLPQVIPLIRGLAAALRESHADYEAALKDIARLSEGWDPRIAYDGPKPIHAGSVWYRDRIFAEPGEETGPDEMSEREWRVYCDAARRAIHRSGT